MVKPILFIDFDGTLCHDRFWRNHPRYEEISQFLFVERGKLVGGWMLGNFTSEEINSFVASHLRISFRELWQFFVRDCESMHVSKKLLKKIKNLSSAWQTVLMTDNMDCFSDITVPSLALDKYFDHIWNSAKEKVFKANWTASFGEVSKKLGTGLESAILIDDSPRNCSNFSILGGTSLLIENGKNLEFYIDEIANKTI